MLFMAKFRKPADPDEEMMPSIIVDAADGDDALDALRAHGIEETPIRLVEIPPRVFCAEVMWSDDEAGDNEAEEDEHNPANYSSAGVVLEVSDRCAAYLELDENASDVIDVATPGGGGG